VKAIVRVNDLRRYLPVIFLMYGLFSVFTLQRDFSHITKLSIFMLLVGPSFMFLALLSRVIERLADDSKWNRYGTWVQFANLSATQTMTQYILMFCLPFYVVKEEWFYFGLNLLALASVLWDPLYRRLLLWAVYRHGILAWSLMSASSFLFPFLFPSRMNLFYPALAIASLIGFIPTRREKSYVLLLLGLWITSLIPLFVISPRNRFPILSVWTKAAHFAFRNPNEERATADLAKSISNRTVKDFVGEGGSLCCVAPVVAPPGFRVNIKQEWRLGDRVIESVQLKTPIQGNVKQAAFHSYFCKQRFPFGNEDERLSCRILIGEAIDIGGTAIEVLH